MPRIASHLSARLASLQAGPAMATPRIDEAGESMRSEGSDDNEVHQQATEAANATEPTPQASSAPVRTACDALRMATAAITAAQRIADAGTPGEHEKFPLPSRFMFSPSNDRASYSQQIIPVRASDAADDTDSEGEHDVAKGAHRWV